MVPACDLWFEPGLRREFSAHSDLVLIQQVNLGRPGVGGVGAGAPARGARQNRTTRTRIGQLAVRPGLSSTDQGQSRQGYMNRGPAARIGGRATLARQAALPPGPARPWALACAHKRVRCTAMAPDDVPMPAARQCAWHATRWHSQSVLFQPPIGPCAFHYWLFFHLMRRPSIARPRPCAPSICGEGLGPARLSGSPWPL